MVAKSANEKENAIYLAENYDQFMAYIGDQDKNSRAAWFIYDYITSSISLPDYGFELQFKGLENLE